MIVVMLMAGSNESFQQQGFAYAKPLVEIDGRPIAEHAWSCLKSIGDCKFVFVIRKEDDMRFHLGDMLGLLEPTASIVRTEGATAGAACTALLAIQHLAADEELLIANGDQVFTADVGAAIDDFRARKLDAGTLVFDSVHPRWSFVRLGSDGLVIEAAEKRPLSRLATAGLYYFRSARDYVQAAQTMIRKGASVNGAYYVCPTFNELILQSRRVGVVQIDREQYVSLATPQAVEEYEQLLASRRRARAS
jgi:dTDP-glucose pyrophosphorylase